MATLPYEVLKRKHTITHKDGSKVVKESKNFYLRYRLNGKLIYKPLGENETEAKRDAIGLYADAIKNAPASYSKKSLRSYVLKNHWTDPLLCPPYKEFRTNISDHSFHYSNSLRVASSLSLVFEKMEDEIGKKDYASINKADVKAFKARLLNYRDEKDKPLTPTTINRIFTALNDVYKYIIANEEKELIINPFSREYTPRVPTERPKEKFVFQPKEIKRLLDYDLLKMCKDFKLVMFEGSKFQKDFKEKFFNKFLDGPYYKALCVMALTGMRFNEVAAIKKKSFKYDGHVLEIEEAFKTIIYGNLMKNYLNGDTSIKVFGPPKSGRPRSIVLCDKAYYILKPLLDACEDDEDLLFVKRRKEGKPRNLYPIYDNNVKQYLCMFLRGFCERFNIKVPDDEIVSPHCLRTTLNTNLLRESEVYKIKESWIAAYLGWTTKTLTKTQATHYTHFSLQTMWEVADGINRLYTGKSILWNSTELVRRDYNVEAAEAEIRGQKQELKFLNLKMKLLEFRLRLADFERVGIEGKAVRNSFRIFLNATDNYNDITDFNGIRDLLMDSKFSILGGLKTCEKHFPQEAEVLRVQVQDLYKAAFITI